MPPTLYVDDSRPDRALVKALLKGGEHEWLRGNQFDVSSQPPEDVAEYGHYRFVILDMHMGVTTGIAEARRIRAAHPCLPYLILISGALPELSAEDQALFVALIDKNHPVKMLDAIRDVMRHYGGR